MIWLANLVVPSKSNEQSWEIPVMADLQSWLSRGGAAVAQVKLRESEQKPRAPEVTNGILTSS